MVTLPLALSKSIYITYNFISYKLPQVLRQKNYYHLEIYSFSLKGSKVFLAFLHNSFWPLKWYETIILACKKCTGTRQIKSLPNRQCGKAGNTIDPLKEGAPKAASL